MHPPTTLPVLCLALATLALLAYGFVLAPWLVRWLEEREQERDD